MNVSEIRRISYKLDEGILSDEIPVEELIRSLSSQNPEKIRTAIRALRLLVEKDVSLVDPEMIPVQVVLLNVNPPSLVEFLRLLEALGKQNTNILRDAIEDLVELLEAEDISVRVAACSAIATLATEAPLSIYNYLDQLSSHVNDEDPRVRISVFEALSAVVEEEYDSAVNIIEVAVDALDNGNEFVRDRALMYLVSVVEQSPNSIAGHANHLLTPLNDPVTRHRGRAAYLVSELVQHDSDTVTELLESVVKLLNDPNLATRQNATFTLLAWEHDNKSLDFPIKKIGKKLPELLTTDVIAIQENAIYLTLKVIEREPNVVVNPDRVQTRIRELQSDPAIDVPNHVFDSILKELVVSQSPLEFSSN